MDDHLPLLAGVSDRGLRFEIELLLAKAVEYAAEPMACRLDRFGRVAAGDAAGRADKAAELDRPLDREDRLGRRRVDLYRSPGRGERIARFGGDHHDRLANVQ